MSNHLIDQAVHLADSAICSTQHAGEQASALVHQGMDAARGGSRHVRDSAHHATDRTVAYIHQEPVKAMLIAAATGAVLVMLAKVIGTSGSAR